jgi:hypothetical protein
MDRIQLEHRIFVLNCKMLEDEITADIKEALGTDAEHVLAGEGLERATDAQLQKYHDFLFERAVRLGWRLPEGV